MNNKTSKIIIIKPQGLEAEYFKSEDTGEESGGTVMFKPKTFFSIHLNDENIVNFLKKTMYPICDIEGIFNAYQYPDNLTENLSNASELYLNKQFQFGSPMKQLSQKDTIPAVHVLTNQKK